MTALEPKPLSRTAAPCVASARAMPRPMPLVEPVTTATRPFNVIVMAGIEPRRAQRRPLDLGSRTCRRVAQQLCEQKARQETPAGPSIRALRDNDPNHESS